VLVGDRAAGVEARVVDRGHELLREEGAHRLPDEVCRGDARDPETVGDVRGDGRLAGAGGAADQQDDRQVELVEVLEAAQPAHRGRAVLLAERLPSQLLEPLERDRLAAALRQLRVGRQRDLVSPVGRDAGSHQRTRHQALRERQAVLAAERQRPPVPAVGHLATALCAMAWSASRTSSESRSSTPTGTSSLSANTTSTPRSSAASATTSIAAALISTRKTSASTRSTSSRRSLRRARLPETRTTSAPCSSRRCLPMIS